MRRHISGEERRDIAGGPIVAVPLHNNEVVVTSDEVGDTITEHASTEADHQPSATQSDPAFAALAKQHDLALKSVKMLESNLETQKLRNLQLENQLGTGMFIIYPVGLICNL